MKCPDCAVELGGAERKAIHLDVCGECSGMWLAQPALAKLVPVLEREGPKALPFAGASQRCCPACGINMNLIAFKEVQLDFCGACHGVWFDEGELKSAIAKQRSGAAGVVGVTAVVAAGGIAAAALQADAANPGLAERIGSQLSDAGSAAVSGIDLGDAVEFVGSLLIEVIAGILE